MHAAVPTAAPRRGLLAGLLVLVTAVAFEAQAVSTAMPAAAQDLGQLDLYAWAFTAFMIPQIVAIVWGGRLSDAVGPIRPLQAGVAVFAAGVALSALAVSMPMLLAGRFVQGFGGGLTNLALMVLVGRAFPPADTGRVMTWFSFAWMLPSFVGPPAAAFLVRWASWHAVFWAVLPLVLVGSLLLYPTLAAASLRAVDAAGSRPARLSAAVAVALGVGLLQAAGQRLAWWSVPLAVVGVALLATRVRALMPPGWRALGAGLDAVIAVRALATGAFFGFASFLPLMIVQLRGEQLLTAGSLMTVASLGWTGGSWLQSRRWVRLSRDGLVTLGTLLVAAGLGVVAVATWLPWLPLPLVGVGAVASGAGMGLASSSTSILVIQLSADAQLGRNTGALQVAEALGNAVIVGLAGTAFALFVAGSGQRVEAFGVPSVFVAACAALSVGFSRRMGHVENLSAAPARVTGPES